MLHLSREKTKTKKKRPGLAHHFIFRQNRRANLYSKKFIARVILLDFPHRRASPIPLTNLHPPVRSPSRRRRRHRPSCSLPTRHSKTSRMTTSRTAFRVTARFDSRNRRRKSKEKFHFQVTIFLLSGFCNFLLSFLFSGN